MDEPTVDDKRSDWEGKYKQSVRGGRVKSTVATISESKPVL